MSFHPPSVGLNNHAITANPNATGAGYTDLAALIADSAFNTAAANINKIVRVESPLSLHWLTASGAFKQLAVVGDHTFLDLADTFSSYSGLAGQVLQVNAAANGVEAGQALRTIDSPTFGGLTSPGQLISTKSGGGSDAGIHVASGTPAWSLRETDAAVDAKQWNIAANAGQLRMEAVNDANNVFVNFMTIDRTGTVIDAVNFPNGVVTISNTLNMTSGLINNVLDPVAAQDAATKNYVDTSNVQGFVDASGTPVANQLARFIDANTIGGDPDLTFDGANLTTTGQLISTKSGGGSDAGIHVIAATPAWSLRETDAALDAKQWNIAANAGQLRMEAVNDANSIFTNFLTVDRTGTTINAVNFPNGVVTISNALDMTAGLINNVLNPVAAQDAATKNYVDTHTGNAIWTKTGSNIFPTTLTDKLGLGNALPLSKLFIDGVQTVSVQGDAIRITDNFGDGVYISLGTARNLGIFTGGLTFFGFNNNYDPVANSYQRGFALPAVVQEYNLAGDVDYKTAPTGAVGTSYVPTSRLRIMNNGLVSVGAPTAVGKLHVFTENIATIGFIVQQESGQTADLMQLRNSASAVLTKFTSAGVLDMGAKLINSVLDPVSAQDAATKNYVDSTSGNVTTAVTLTNNFVLRGNGGVDINIGSVTMSADGEDLLANMFIASEIGSGINAAVQVNSIEPSFALNETNAAVDNKRWNFSADDETLRFELVNDVGGVFVSFMDVDRTGTVVDSVAFPRGNIIFDTDTLIVHAALDQVAIGNAATPLTDLTIFQGSNSLKGLTFSGVGVTGSSTTEGVSLFAGNIGAANNQLWIVNKVDQGNAAKNSFRFITGTDVPLIVGVNNIGTINKNLCFGVDSPNAGAGFGFPFTAVQADINAKVHIQTGSTGEIGFIIEAKAGQIVDLMQLHNSSGNPTSVINSVDRWGIGKPLPLGKVHIQTDNTVIPSLIIQQIAVQSANILELRDSAGVITSVWTKDNFLGVNTPIPTIQFHVSSAVNDNVPVARFQKTGSNPGSVSFHAGDRDPSGVVSAGDGAIYYKTTDRTSGVFENRSNLIGADWFKHAVNPINTIEIVQADDFDALASGGVVTISVNTTLHIKGAITTSNRIVVNSGITLHITATFFGSKNFVYTGTGTFLTTDGGTIRIQGGPSIVSVSTGTFMSFSGTGTLSMTDVAAVGWDNIGTFSDGTFLHRNVAYINCDSGWTITDAAAIIVNIASQFGTTMNDSFFTVNTKNPLSFYTFNNASAQTLAATGAALFNLNGRISNTAAVIISDSGAAAGKLFLSSALANATINSVVDSSPAAGTITQFADDVTGVSTTVFSTTTYFEDEEVTQSGTTSYNGTFQIFGVVAGVSYKIRRAFVADDATGSIASVRIDMTLAAGHGIITGDQLKVINTNFYNGFRISLNVATNVLTVNDIFRVTDSGFIKRGFSLDETDPRVNADDNFGFPDSHFISCAHVNNNSTANGTIVNNTFTDMVFGTAGAALVASTTMQRTRLTDELNGTFENIGSEPFDGLITFDFTVESSGGSVDFRFKWQIDTGGGFVDLADPVESLVNVGGDAQSVTKTFPLAWNKGDKIKPQITRNSGSSGITTLYATIYATNS